VTPYAKQAQLTLSQKKETSNLMIKFMEDYLKHEHEVMVEMHLSTAHITPFIQWLNEHNVQYKAYTEGVALGEKRKAY
jgi:hypothetical protein